MTAIFHSSTCRAGHGRYMSCQYQENWALELYLEGWTMHLYVIIVPGGLDMADTCHGNHMSWQAKRDIIDSIIAVQ